MDEMDVPEWYVRAQCPEYDNLSPRSQRHRMILLQEEYHHTFVTPAGYASGHSTPTTDEIESLSMASTNEMNLGSESGVLSDDISLHSARPH